MCVHRIGHRDTASTRHPREQKLECGLKNKHIYSVCSQRFDFIAPFGIQSPVLACCILLFKHTSPVRCKVRKLLTGTFGRRNPWFIQWLLSKRRICFVCMCVFLYVFVWVYLYLCVLGFMSKDYNPKSEKCPLRKKLNTIPWFLKLGTWSQNMWVNNKSWGRTDQRLRAKRCKIPRFWSLIRSLRLEKKTLRLWSKWIYLLFLVQLVCKSPAALSLCRLCLYLDEVCRQVDRQWQLL